MKVSMLNPLGYEAQTEKGNKYKKSNGWKTLAVTTAIIDGAAAVVVPKLSKNSLVKSVFAMTGPQYDLSCLENWFRFKTPKKFVKPVVAAIWALNTAICISGGILLDNILSKKRAQKADGIEIKQKS